MRRLMLVIMLVLVLLTLFAGVAFATCPEYEDKAGVSHGGKKSASDCIQVAGPAAVKGNFTPCSAP